jgi:hypothetical protein
VSLLSRQSVPAYNSKNEKKAWYFHKSSWHMRQNSGYDGYGYNNSECNPEGRCHSEFGRIEDDEVIQRHREIEEGYRKRNALS